MSNLDLKDAATANTIATTETLTAESLQLSDFFHSRGTAHVIQPLLRYCKYELTREGKLTKEQVAAICDVPIDTAVGENDDGDELENDDDLIRQKKLADNDDDDDDVTTITFRGETVQIEEPSIKMAMMKIDTTKDELEAMSSSKKKKKVKASAKDAKFMELLNGYDDVVSTVSQSLKGYEGMASGPAVNKKRYECSLLIGYFKYAKIQLLMKRNEKMVNELRNGDSEMTITKKQSNKDIVREDADAKYKRVEEIAHLYDALLQDAKSIVHLPGGGSAEEGDNLEDEFVLEANANVLRIRALRSYYIGRMYAADTVAKYSESLALFDQAELLATEAAEEIAACQEMEKAHELIKAMADLKNEITAVQVRTTRASSFLTSRGSEASSVTSGLTLLCRLDDFDSGGLAFRVADVPPSLKPIPCKPEFFDIANNYVRDIPMDELEFHANAVKAKGSRGFMSWFRKN